MLWRGFTLGTLVGAIFPRLAERVLRRPPAEETPRATPEASSEPEPIPVEMDSAPSPAATVEEPAEAIIAPVSPEPAADSPDGLYVTGTAKKYHVRGCKSVEGRELIPITRAHAVERGISACRMCQS